MQVTSHTLATLKSIMAQHVAMLILAMAMASALALGNSSSSVINATCAYDVLSGDPAAANATDARGVATAAVNIAAQKDASTLQAITYLVNELKTCREMYGTMDKLLASVLRDFRAGRFDNEALKKATNASGVPDDCDIMLFQGNSHKDPISDENGDNREWAKLATGILEYSFVIKASSKRGT